MLDVKKFSELLFGLGEMYNQKFSQIVVDLYYNALKNYDFEQINKAAQDCIKTHKYSSMPKPAHFIEMIDGDPDDRARIAWTMAHKALKEVGYYNSVEFADPVISQVIHELGGWIIFCDTRKTEIPFVEKRFIDFYRTIAKRKNKKPVKLLGYVEIKNKNTGYSKDIPETIKIGFQDEKGLIKK